MSWSSFPLKRILVSKLLINPPNAEKIVVFPDPFGPYKIVIPSFLKLCSKFKNKFPILPFNKTDRFDII